MSNDDKGTPTGKARNAAVAGRFYPGEGPTLRSMVETSRFEKTIGGVLAQGSMSTSPCSESGDAMWQSTL